MSANSPPLTIHLDPWEGPDGAILQRCDASLLAAVVAGDPLAVQVALLQGGNPLAQIIRTQGKEHRAIVGLSAWHDPVVAKALLEVFCSVDYTDRKQFVLAVMASSGVPVPQDLIIWFLRKEAAHFPKFDRGQYWRFLAARRCWDVMRECRDLLWDWENIHAGSNHYTCNFIWTRAVLTNDPAAVLIKQWMRDVFFRYENANYVPSTTLIDEFSLQYDLGFEEIEKTRVIEDLSSLVSPGGCLIDEAARLPSTHALTALLRAAIDLAAAREAQGAASILLAATPQVDAMASRGRL